MIFARQISRLGEGNEAGQIGVDNTVGRVRPMGPAILGAWLGLTVCMWFAASGSFTTLGSVLEEPNPQFREATSSLEDDETRVILRSLASEISRTYFRAYGWAQSVLWALLIILLVRQTSRDALAPAVVGLVLAVVIVLSCVVTPRIVSIGRALEFVARDPVPPEMGQFRVLHGLYAALDGVKFLAGLAPLARWVVGR